MKHLLIIVGIVLFSCHLQAKQCPTSNPDLCETIPKKNEVPRDLPEPKKQQSSLKLPYGLEPKAYEHNDRDLKLSQEGQYDFGHDANYISIQGIDF